MPRVLQFSLWYLWWTFTNSFNLSPSNDGAMAFYRKCLAQKARSKRESLQNSDKGEHLSLRYLEISIRQQLGCSNNCDSRYIHPSSWLCVGQDVTSISKLAMVIFMPNRLSILHWFEISTVLLTNFYHLGPKVFIRAIFCKKSRQMHRNPENPVRVHAVDQNVPSWESGSSWLL